LYVPIARPPEVLSEEEEASMPARVMERDEQAPERVTAEKERRGRGDDHDDDDDPSLIHS
jgi:hypothetical protein